MNKRRINSYMIRGILVNICNTDISKVTDKYYNFTSSERVITLEA